MGYSGSIKVLSIIGYSGSGKTTSVEAFLKWVKSQPGKNVHVIVAKNIGHHSFTFDAKGKNTYRFAEAGADVVIGNSGDSAVVMMNRRLELNEIFKTASQEFEALEKLSKQTNPGAKPFERIVILEGFRSYEGPTLLSVKSVEDYEKQIKMSENIVCITGSIGSDRDELSRLITLANVQYVNALESPEKIYPFLHDLSGQKRTENEKCC